MRVSDLVFSYTESQIATVPQYPPRVMSVDVGQNVPREISFAQIADVFQAGDVLVLNETKVIPRRIFGRTDRLTDFEILFVDKNQSPADDGNIWQVLCPAARLKPNEKIFLPDDVSAEVVSSGRVQTLRTSRSLENDYFEKFGDVPLPPYIQKARGARKSTEQDRAWYQTEWAKNAGSSAAPTASLHFRGADLDKLRARGVQIVSLTLHVGLGTYLPVTVADLRDHVMHREDVSVPRDTWTAVQTAKKEGARIWALGTTSLRALESLASQVETLKETSEGFAGSTSLLIYPGYEFRIVSGLLTNFHQPESTLLALVCAFAGFDRTLSAYAWAVKNKFRFFSYGDLTVWTR